MASMAQVQRGIAAFIDAEIAPKLSGLTRIIVAGSGGIIASKLSGILNNSKYMSLLTGLSLIDESGDVDIDTIYAEFKRAVQQAGQVTFEIPIPFQPPLEMTFRDADLDRLYQYIRQS